MFPKTALRRQIAEAVLIARWGEDTILNSKSEFNRCKIGRLVIGEEDRTKNESDKRHLGEWEGGMCEGESTSLTWERTRTKERRAMEVRDSGVLERGLAFSPARKRVMGEEFKTPGSSNKKQKRKYPLLEENWGEESEDSHHTPTLLDLPPPPPTSKQEPAAGGDHTPPPPPDPTIVLLSPKEQSNDGHPPPPLLVELPPPPTGSGLTTRGDHTKPCPPPPPPESTAVIVSEDGHRRTKTT